VNNRTVCKAGTLLSVVAKCLSKIQWKTDYTKAEYTWHIFS